MKCIGLILVFISGVCIGQIQPKNCYRIYVEAHKLFEIGNYELALKKLDAYKLCDPSKSDKADSLILQVYQTISFQKKEAIAQRNLANKRAEVIKAQADSLVKENISNIIATEALQTNELNPTQALKEVLVGLCYSPENPALTEIKRKIINSEALFLNMIGSSPYRTTQIKKLNSTTLVTADGNSEIKFWDIETKRIIKIIKPFKKAISNFEIVNENYILAIGREVESATNNNDNILLIETSTLHITSITDSFPSSYTAISSMRDGCRIYLADKSGAIKEFSILNKSISVSL